MHEIESNSPRRRSPRKQGSSPNKRRKIDEDERADITQDEHMQLLEQIQELEGKVDQKEKETDDLRRKRLLDYKEMQSIKDENTNLKSMIQTPEKQQQLV